MPELDTSTFALLRTSRLLVKWMLPKYSGELDRIAENNPLLGEVLWKAIDWAPKLLRVIPPDHPNLFALETSSDDSENDSLEETSGSHILRRLNNWRSLPPVETAQDSPQSSERFQSEDVQYQPQPGPSTESQPGTSQAPQSRTVTGRMLQAALQAVFSSQAGVAEVTFAWQLKSMRDMGFTDEKACIDALVKHGGDVDSAVHELLQD